MTQDNLTNYISLANDFNELCKTIVNTLDRYGLIKYRHTNDFFSIDEENSVVTCTGFYLGKRYLSDFPTDLLFMSSSELEKWAKKLADDIDEENLSHEELVALKKLTIVRKKR